MMIDTEQTPQFIEVTPVIKGVKCRLIHYSLYGAITFAPLLIAAWVGYTYDWWMGCLFFLFSTLASGVVVSKMRFSAIPPTQREMNYSTFAIVQWYIAKNICLLD